MHNDSRAQDRAQNAESAWRGIYHRLAGDLRPSHRHALPLPLSFCPYSFAITILLFILIMSPTSVGIQFLALFTSPGNYRTDSYGKPRLSELCNQFFPYKSNSIQSYRDKRENSRVLREEFN